MKIDLSCFLYTKPFSGESFALFFSFSLVWVIKFSGEEKTQSFQCEKCSDPIEVGGKCHWLCRSNTPAATFFQSHWRDYMWSRAEE